MGVFADLLANAKTIKANGQLENFVQSKINSQLDPAIAAAASVTNAVHNLAVSTQTAGNMTLTVTLRSGETFTTGNIAFNAAAATIETAIDVAATAAAITGWTNGDITVSGGAVNVGAVILTFDGASVAGVNHPITVLTDVDGSGGAWGAITITTAGQTARYALGTLIALGVLSSGTVATQTASASNSGFAAGPNFGKFPNWALRELAREMAAEDGNNNTYHSVVESVPMDDKARLAQRIGNSSEV